MKIFGELAAVIAGAFVIIVLLFWGVSALIYYPWASGCKDAGHSVQEHGYGIPMFTSTYVCVDVNGNAVDWL